MRSGIDLLIRTVLTAAMKTVFLMVSLAALVSSGCFWRRWRHHDREAEPEAAQSFTPMQPSVGANPQIVVTSETANVGKVARVNTVARFVVLNFPPGRIPAVEQILMVYRRGLKVGEVKVTGPIQDENVVADITSGDSEVGDEVRDK
jgi:hypothetical protein